MSNDPLPSFSPCQKEGEGNVRTDFVAERRLLEEVLRDAIECWQAYAAIGVTDGPVGRRQRLYREADFWIFGDYDNAPCFSFAKVCDCLALDPDFIRRRLLEWRQTQEVCDASHSEAR